MKKKVVVAFSGGLDTSFTVMYLAKEKGYEVYAACANTGGFSEEQLKQNEENAYKLGATKYVTIDVTKEYYEKSLKYMVFGNVLRNGTYPISVSSERIFQALAIARYANEIGADAIAHGSTGAGKTTITNLINRFYDIQDGKIRYDGININKIKKADLRKSLGIVLQDTHLFTATVMDNIRFGKLDATDEEVIAAAKLANADTFIRQLPDGYNTVLTGDGANLSQGQRQLLSIARAAVADPPVLILDEATSSIDTRTEKIVQDGMDKLMKGRTTFVIAHRLSTVKNSDCIMVLEQGRIIERGNHDELIAQKGRYYQLYTGNAIAEG